MIASSCLRASKMVVGISIKDKVGSIAAVKKALAIAKPGDSILAVHIPTVMPETMMSSLSTLESFDEDQVSALGQAPGAAGKLAIEAVKEAVGNGAVVDYRLAKDASNIKIEMLKLCKAEKADFLFLGAGVDGAGSLPQFAVNKYNGITVCIVRDHVE